MDYIKPQNQKKTFSEEEEEEEEFIFHRQNI